MTAAWPWMFVAAMGFCNACALSANPDPEPDAGSPPMCMLTATRPATTAAVGDRVAYQAQLTLAGDVFGTPDLTWRITHDFTDPIAARAVQPELLATDPRQMSFVADQPGPYRVELTGRVGSTPCSIDAPDVMNVRAPGARSASYRFRLTQPSQSTAVADTLRTVWGGANYHHGALALPDLGPSIPGVIDTVDGLPVHAYIRIVARDGGSAYETSSDPTTGGFVARLAPATAHDLLVIPRDGRAPPARFAVDPVTALMFTLPAGAPISGTVTGRDGMPLVAASVALHTGDLPAAATRTVESGDFALVAHPGPTEITVVPATGGLELRLRIAADVPGSGGTVDVTYDSDLPMRPVAAQVVEGGTPVPEARVTWISRDLADPAIVTTSWAGSLPTTGRFRAGQLADSGGDLPTIDLPAAIYDVVIDPRGTSGITTSLEVDLRVGQPIPPTLALAFAAQITGRIVDRDGAGVADARIVAAPRGPTAESTATVTSSDPTGAFTLALIPDRAYEVTVTGKQLVHGRKHLALIAGSPGAIEPIGDVTVPPVLRWTGSTRLEGGGMLSGVVVEAFCATCGPDEQTWPVAQAVSDDSGFFTLPMPDPGTSQ